jgi:peptidyl-prolyl cis-trans isomerase C
MILILRRTALATLFLALGALSFEPAASAQTQSDTAQPGAPGDENPVVARVNGEDILRSEVFALAGTLPPEYQQQILQIYPLLVQRLVDFRLAQAAGRAEGLGEDAEVKKRIEELTGRVIREVWIERAVEARITDEALQSRYQDYVKANPPATEQHARHILVASEEEARAVIAELDGGADFVELAKERSTGPSGPRGGDLGYFTSDQMVPEFSAAAQTLEPGQYSKDPVQTQFGWHVIKLEDRRESTPPSFADMEQQLRQEMTRENVETVLSELREGAEVEITPAGNSMVPEGGGTQ